MKKINIVQFLPYFPPHKGGLETVAEEFSKYYVNGGYGSVTNITSNIGQTHNHLRYKQDCYNIISIPSIEIIFNFPLFKFRTKEYKESIQYLKTQELDIIQTHTRFFLQTFIGGLFAKKNNLKRVHVEHGSGFVQGLSRWKKIIADIYDHTLGRWVFNNANEIIVISKKNKEFVRKFAKNTPISLIYRGLDFSEIQIKEKRSHKKEGPGKKVNLMFIGRLVKLKGVDILLRSIKELIDNGTNNFELNIIGDGDERKNLEKYVLKHNLNKNVKFLGYIDNKTIKQELLPNNDIFINPSLQEGLPTTVIEALFAKNFVIATDVGGTKEISNKSDLIIINPNNTEALSIQIKLGLDNYYKHKGVSYKIIKSKFNRDKNIKKYYNIYAD